jgi:hypothetical protein
MTLEMPHMLAFNYTGGQQMDGEMKFRGFLTEKVAARLQNEAMREKLEEA